jgi:uncharacterized protein YbjQ (UPF0145 family)
MHQALQALRDPAHGSGHPFVSDLSVGDLVLLDEVGLEPVDLVSGAGSASMSPQAAVTPQGCDAWAWALTTAVDGARHAIERELVARQARGVVAVQMQMTREPGNVVTCTMLGTAVVPRRRRDDHGPTHGPTTPFTTALSAADVHLLVRGGYTPTALVVGAAVAAFGSRSLQQGLGLSRDNVELAAQTGALYRAREQAMARLQAEAVHAGAHGVVGVTVSEHPLSTMMVHVVELLVLGTAVRRGAGGHRSLDPALQLELHDPSPDVFQRG